MPPLVAFRDSIERLGLHESLQQAADVARAASEVLPVRYAPPPLEMAPGQRYFHHVDALESDPYEQDGSDVAWDATLPSIHPYYRTQDEDEFNPADYPPDEPFPDPEEMEEIREREEAEKAIKEIEEEKRKLKRVEQEKKKLMRVKEKRKKLIAKPKKKV